MIAYEGNPKLIDYAATKAVGVGFTRVLSHSLIKRKRGLNYTLNEKIFIKSHMSPLTLLAAAAYIATFKVILISFFSGNKIGIRSSYYVTVKGFLMGQPCY